MSPVWRRADWELPVEFFHEPRSLARGRGIVELSLWTPCVCLPSILSCVLAGFVQRVSSFYTEERIVWTWSGVGSVDFTVTYPAPGLSLAGAQCGFCL